jgi:hypothetical protein
MGVQVLLLELFMTDYSGYSWIKVKRYKMDESLSWEERYKQLEQHHIEETQFLIDEVRNLATFSEGLMKTIHALDGITKPEPLQCPICGFDNVCMKCMNHI